MLNTLTSTVEDNEGKPRLSHPLPSDRLERNVHPNQRNLREGSFVFPSSSGEESSVAAEGTRGTQLDKRGKMKFGMVCKTPLSVKSQKKKNSALVFLEVSLCELCVIFSILLLLVPLKTLLF